MKTRERRVPHVGLCDEYCRELEAAREADRDETKEEIRLDIHLKFGGPCGVVFDRPRSSFRFNRLKNITPLTATRTT